MRAGSNQRPAQWPEPRFAAPSCLECARLCIRAQQATGLPSYSRCLQRGPSLDIFTQAFVLRDEAGGQITHAGKAFLAALETPIQVAAPIDKAAEPALLLTRMPASPVRGSNDPNPCGRAG